MSVRPARVRLSPQRGRLAPSPAALAEELMLLQDRLRTWGVTGPPAEATDTPPPPSR